MSIFKESRCDRTQVWGQKRVPLNTKFTLTVLKSAWSIFGGLAIGSTILFSSLNVAQASNVATSSLGGINGTSATQGANNSVSTPAKKMSVGVSMAREMFPTAMEDEENTLGDKSLEDPLALVHDRAALERNAKYLVVTTKLNNLIAIGLRPTKKYVLWLRYYLYMGRTACKIVFANLKTCI